MIRRLRVKFIIINMTLVCLVLTIVFFAICLFSYQRLRQESMDAMTRIIQQRSDMQPAKPDFDVRKPRKLEPMVPVFCVVIDESGAIVKTIIDNAQVSEETAAAASTQALSLPDKTGVLKDMGLRYLREITPEGIKIAFADTSNERRSMMSMIVTSALVGLGGLSAFFFISLYLSGWALKPVDRAWQQQRRFVADASHELKTPLTVILTNTDILMSHQNDTIGSQAKWVEYIRAEAGRMKELINDLLFLAKSDDSRQRLTSLSEINVSDLAWSCILPFESVAYEHKLGLDCEISPDLFMYADEGQLKQLIVILMDNACKYSQPAGQVTVVLDKHQDKIQISVNNTGSIIPQENLNHIFERFYRADESRQSGGYGLGLPIAKSIVENHRGRIWAKSTPESGTTLYVLLPVK